MCLMIIAAGIVAGAPVLVAANREERFDRSAEAPARRPGVPGQPAVLSGLDREAGGTWLGVNESGLLAAVTNRRASVIPPAPRSRGLLCRDLLSEPDAVTAAGRAHRELESGRYAGANYLCADRAQAIIVHGGDRIETVAVAPGVHYLTNADLDDPRDRRIAEARRIFGSAPPRSVADFLDRAAAACSAPAVIVRGDGRGTVSGELVALTIDPAKAVYRHAGGPPDRTAYADRSSLLRALLAGAEAAT
jgi:uncharacterized protein with NRDE domain